MYMDNKACHRTKGPADVGLRLLIRQVKNLLLTSREFRSRSPIRHLGSGDAPGYVWEQDDAKLNRFLQNSVEWWHMSR